MILTRDELLAAFDEQLPPNIYLIVPDTIEVERPGESLGQLYRSPRGKLTYRSYT